MRINVVPPCELSEDQLETWARLQGEAGLSSPFLTPAWLHALEEAGGPDQGFLRVAVIGDGPQPCGFLAARVVRGVAGPAGAPLCDYQAVVASEPLPLAPQALVSAFGAVRLEFDKLMPGQPALAPHVRGEAPAFMISLADGFDAYAAERTLAGTDILRDISKKRRKFEREHGALVFSADDKDAFDGLLSWKRAQYISTGQPDIFHAGWPETLLRRLLASKDPTCRARLFSLRSDGELVAAHLALVGESVLHAWFIAHGARLARYSPGLILLADVLGWAAAEGVCEVDLGPGAYRFKRSLATRTRTLTYGFVGRPSAANLARAAAYGVRAAAEALPLGAASKLPGKAMRRLDLLRSLK
jgi:CelD/BcsL family acetyltransferase involved in cellulose biosynthesis